MLFILLLWCSLIMKTSQWDENSFPSSFRLNSLSFSSPTLICNKYLFFFFNERSRIFVLISDFLFTLFKKNILLTIHIWIFVFLNLWFMATGSTQLLWLKKKSRKSELYCLHTTLASIYSPKSYANWWRKIKFLWPKNLQFIYAFIQNLFILVYIQIIHEH